MAKTNDAKDTTVKTGENFKVLEPPHNLHLARKMGVVKCRVDLYKIPPQLINFEPTKTHLYLDTFKFTKKYRLEVPYPEGVHVDTNVEASFNSGVLTCDFPILNDPNKPADHDKIVEARAMVVDMRKRGIPIPLDLFNSAKMAKTKEIVSVDNNDNNDNNDKKKNLPQKKSKSPLSNKDKRQEEKAKRQLEDAEDPTAPKKKKVKTEKKNKKKADEKRKKMVEMRKKSSESSKSFVDNAADALTMVDEVNDQQEKAIQEKMDREYAKLPVNTRNKIERQDKKVQLRALRKQAADEIAASFPKKSKAKKTTKVSFSEDK